MAGDSFSMGLAVWGAILSTALAFIKIWEVFRERPRLTTSWSFSSRPEDGNEVIIENPSKVPVMISYWELLWIRRNGLRKVTTFGRFPNEGYCNVTIGPHGRHVLEFKDEEYFDANKPRDGAAAIYLKLYVIGRRRPMWLLVHELNKK